ncbi:hypothetical protein BEWA_021780 [Theileria equi strain WA]|uniref:Uncharacterized protein n=1 Tax=Theileria equi strain WA TaxID=1537102 RepID=L0AUV9_THEEQ|nr:hypothetical protein BEWA_021780 [Theileria equi strain WA]AFZ79330.1 hypothetical protein BEWA_021780 [Theileria equi strain WA]|eukprot:XP_004828996.1 hypothetical protein BEWA_021780 [Theileria equi strain WA]
MECAYIPIKNITTYTSNWTILARIIDKSPLKSIKSDNSFMSIDIKDKNGDTIRGKFWGVAATKWDDILQKGNVYTFSKGSVNLANKKFNNTPHNYELTFNIDSQIEQADDIGDIDNERNYNFVTLREIKSTARESPFMVDILCFAKSISPISMTSTKFSKEMKRRTLHIVDDSGYELEITLWGQMAELELLDDILDKPLIVSQITIKEWNGGRYGQSSLASDIKIANQQNVRDKDKLSNLETWYHQALSQNEIFKSLKSQSSISNKETYEFSNIEKINSKTKGGYTFNCKLRRIFWKNKDGTTRLWYQSCPMCFKKVIIDEDSNIYRCIACDDAVVTPVLRFLFTCLFIDYSGQIICNIYGENGTKLIGMTEQQLDALDKDKLKNALDFVATHKDFKISGFYKSKTYNGEVKNTFNVTNIELVNHIDEANMLLDKMQITYDSVLKFLEIKSDDGTIESEPKRTKSIE